MFVALLGVLVGGACLHRGIAHAIPSDEEARLTDALLALLPARTSAAALGRRYLAGAPGERDMARLVEEIASAQSALRRKLLESTPRDRANLLAKQRRDDFRRGAIVQVDGWMLSVTETRICAIACLHAEQGL